MSHYESLWAIMTQNIDTTTHYDPNVSRIQCHNPKKDKRSLSPVSILSQKYFFWSSLDPKFKNALFQMNVYVFEGADYKFGNSFSKFWSPVLFLTQFGPKILKRFVLNETWNVYVFEGADYKFGNSFSKFQPPVLFLAQFCPKI